MGGRLLRRLFRRRNSRRRNCNTFLRFNFRSTTSSSTSSIGSTRFNRGNGLLRCSVCFGLYGGSSFVATTFISTLSFCVKVKYLGVGRLCCSWRLDILLGGSPRYNSFLCTRSPNSIGRSCGCGGGCRLRLLSSCLLLYSLCH